MVAHDDGCSHGAVGRHVGLNLDLNFNSRPEGYIRLAQGAEQFSTGVAGDRQLRTPRVATIPPLGAHAEAFDG